MLWASLVLMAHPMNEDEAKLRLSVEAAGGADPSGWPQSQEELAVARRSPFGHTIGQPPCKPPAAQSKARVVWVAQVGQLMRGTQGNKKRGAAQS